MNLVLLIVGAILGLSVFLGYRKGLVKIVASLLATVIIVLLVGMFTPTVSQWIRKTTPLESVIKKEMVKILTEEPKEGEGSVEGEFPKDEQISLIENAEMPEFFKEMLLENNNKEVYKALGVETFVDYTGAYVAKVLADIIAFLVTFIVVSIVVRIAIGALGIIDKLPLIGGVNRLAGAAVGVGIGIVFVWILFIVVTLCYDTDFGRLCFENIETNPILKTMYDNNLLMKYIVKF